MAGLLARWLVVALLIALSTPAAAALAAQKQVLVLYATRRDAQVAALGDVELPRILERGLGEKIDYYGEYLDLSRFPEPGYQAAVRDFLRQKYKQQQFDLIIAMHDIALQFVASHRLDLFRDVPLVFSSAAVNTTRPANSTGLIAPNQFAETVALAAQLQPELRHVVVVTGADRRDAEFERQVRAQLEPFERRYRLTYLSGLATRQLQDRLASLSRDSIVFYVLVNRDGAGESYHPLDYLERLAAIASVPVYCWVDSAMGRGSIGGSLRSQAKQVEIVGSLALRVLQGEPADNIPTQAAALNVAQLDWRQLRRWGIDQARIPQGTLVMFEAPSVWEQYRTYIVGAIALLLAQSGLIAGLLLQRRRRHMAEQQVRQGQLELRQSYDRIRHLAGRLLTAHEEERARVARDLHDDLGQQLALLWSDLELVSGLSDAETGAAADDALQRLETIIGGVRELSHRLHPSKLRLIGLVPSLHALQRELGKSGLQVTFEHEPVTTATIPPDLALCVYRVVQEALQNAIRHGRARHVRLRLIETTDQLRMDVEDDGVGFDPAAAGHGLGLLSMRERLEAIGGSIEIASRPGAGTHLHIVVPLGGVRAEPVTAPTPHDAAAHSTETVGPKEGGRRTAAKR